MDMIAPQGSTAPSPFRAPPGTPVPPTKTGPTAKVQRETAAAMKPIEPPVIAGPRPGASARGTVTTGPVRITTGPTSPVRTSATRAAEPAATDADIPPELLAASQELEQELLAPSEDQEEQHFQAVFDEFVSVRKRCGEPNDGLTFEKFSTRLKKNRDQLIEKYACKTVRFQVYVKDGKAAVKALPVR
jgi:hypothetical protein